MPKDKKATGKGPVAKPRMERLRGAEAWVFDLDNTLYPASADLFSQIDVRMRDYIAGFLGVELDQAYRIQKQYFRDYGTSLRGLMRCHGMDPMPFLDHVHDVDIDVLSPSPALETALARLPGRKLVFTNASTSHAERVMNRLGIAHHFDAVFDIVAAEYVPKPEPRIYEVLLERHGLTATASVMVEDIARNLEPAADLGMTTVWVRTDSEHGAVGSEEGYVDHVVDDLVEWLHDVIEDRV